jgi:hypothetical protein
MQQGASANVDIILQTVREKCRLIYEQAQRETLERIAAGLGKTVAELEAVLGGEREMVHEPPSVAPTKEQKRHKVKEELYYVLTAAPADEQLSGLNPKVAHVLKAIHRLATQTPNRAVRLSQIVEVLEDAPDTATRIPPRKNGSSNLLTAVNTAIEALMKKQVLQDAAGPMQEAWPPAPAPAPTPATATAKKTKAKVQSKDKSNSNLSREEQEERYLQETYGQVWEHNSKPYRKHAQSGKVWELQKDLNWSYVGRYDSGILDRSIDNSDDEPSDTD